MMQRVLVLLAACALLVGCTTERTLPRVQEEGDRHYRDREWEAARTDYKEYVDRKPGEAEIQMRLARCLIELGQPDAAVSPAAVAFDARPNHAESIETYCLALADSKRTDELFRLLNSNVESRGKVSDYDRLARFLLRVGDPDSAERNFKMAARVDGGKTIEPQLALAEFYKSIGDKANEKKRLRMALYWDPVNQDIYNRLKGLGEVPGPSLKLVPEEMSATATAPDR